MRENELAACPFCGAEARLFTGNTTGITCSNDQCVIYTDIPLPFNDHGHLGSAIAAWNRRSAASLAAGKGEAWQPIETAPEDASVVLFCDADGNRWTDCSPGSFYNGCGLPATHWMPLPPGQWLGGRRWIVVELSKTILRPLAGVPHVFEDVNGGAEPLFQRSVERGKVQFWHQSGYGYLPESRVVIAPDVKGDANG